MAAGGEASSKLLRFLYFVGAGGNGCSVQATGKNDDIANHHASIGERNRSSMFNIATTRKLAKRITSEQGHSPLRKRGNYGKRKMDCNCISDEIALKGL
ncbi:hypothetical protein BAE44_0000321 [Dichanthelium oligosanthes]|uniref:Uncharacterized protein n=1 Tax=Dichanthelium oligosanthes TaxID=888268 RepID=A0A1E5WMQ1_9POAL|nr:hypothetical protein BAE44_0000321 [Dichanthelium oligosanthes]